jgi:hypothetical protein
VAAGGATRVGKFELQTMAAAMTWSAKAGHGTAKPGMPAFRVQPISRSRWRCGFQRLKFGMLRDQLGRSMQPSVAVACELQFCIDRMDHQAEVIKAVAKVAKPKHCRV